MEKTTRLLYLISSLFLSSLEPSIACSSVECCAFQYLTIHKKLWEKKENRKRTHDQKRWTKEEEVGDVSSAKSNINFLEGNPRVRERGLDRERDEKKKEERGLAGIYNSPMSVWPVCTLSLVSKGERRDQKKKKSTDAFIRKWMRSVRYILKGKNCRDQ